MRLRDSVALVTGASAGIGRSVASALAAAGANVVVHGRDADRTYAVAEAVGGVPIVADLSSTDGARTLAERSLGAHGHIDLLVNNAGYGWSGPMVDMPPDEIDRLITTDLTATIALTREVLPQLVNRRVGHLCFVASVAGQVPVAGEAVYGSAKAGIAAFADGLRLELADSGVGVSVVVPSAVATGFFDLRGRPYERTVPRPIPPEAVARAVVRAVEQNRAEVWTPRWVRSAAVIRALAPSVYRNLSARFGESVRSDPRRGLR